MRILLFFLSLGFAISAQANEIPVKSKLSEVTVFLRGAQVTRTSSTSLPPGQHFIVFEDLENTLKAQSIQVSGTGNFMIMDIKERQRYIPVELPDSVPVLLKRLRVKQDSLQEMNYESQWINTRIQILRQERNLITSNPLMQGQSIGDSLELLKGSAEYLRNQLFEIDELLLNLNKENGVTQKKVQGLNQRIQDLQRLLQVNQSNRNRTKLVREIMVQVMVESTTKANLELSYLVTGPSWYPEYDIKAGSLTKPVNLTYKARVNQNTGYDWKGVELTFSTNDPVDSKNKPILVPWIISLDSPRPLSARGSRSTSVAAYIDGVEVLSESAVKDQVILEEDEAPAQNSGTATVESQQLVTTEFKVDLPYTIPSDGAIHYLVLKEYELEAEYQYVAVPKRNKHAYLMARIGDWKNIHLLPSSAHVFYGGTYVGETFIDPAQYRDTLELGLGQDKRVRVERTLSKDETRNETFTNFQVRTLEFCYKVTHTGAQAIPLIVEDQIPISRVDKVTIELEDPEGKAEHEASTGFLRWELNVKPGDQTEWKSGFSIRYPKDKQVYGL